MLLRQTECLLQILSGPLAPHRSHVHNSWIYAMNEGIEEDPILPGFVQIFDLQVVMAENGAYCYCDVKKLIVTKLSLCNG